MPIRMRLGVVGALAAMLCACATQPEIPFDKTQASHLKTIGIVTPSMPDKPTVWLASDVGQSFGLIGALVDAGIQAHRDAVLWNAIDGVRNPPRTAFVNALEASLRRQGFDVKMIEAQRPDGHYLKTYPRTHDPIDAYLDVTFIGGGYGYVAAAMGKATPYRPFVYLHCRLVRASDGATLMQDAVFDNAIGAPKDTVTISANPTYQFTDFAAMRSHPQDARNGMDDAFRTTANMIGTLIR